MTDLTQLPWTAEPDGNIYTATPDGRRNVGMMASRDLAVEAAESHNAALVARMASARAARRGVTRVAGLTGVQLGDGNTQNNVF